MTTQTRIPEILRKHEKELLADWVRELTESGSGLTDGQVREECAEFLKLLGEAAQGNSADVNGSGWASMRELLGAISRSRSLEGATPTQTAMFVFSFKKPLFARLRKEMGSDAQALANETWLATELLDRLGLYTTETYLKAREEVIARQNQDMLELSTPVVKLWDGILALPLIGTLDSARTQVVMEALLQRIVETGSSVAIIDITGVPTVDTLVAQHLLKTVTAARLMGADCIISGIRPQIAQTIVHLGVALGDVTTKSNLADAFIIALQRTGATISRSSGRQSSKAE